MAHEEQTGDASKELLASTKNEKGTYLQLVHTVCGRFNILTRYTSYSLDDSKICRQRTKVQLDSPGSRILMAFSHVFHKSKRSRNNVFQAISSVVCSFFCQLYGFIWTVSFYGLVMEDSEYFFLNDQILISCKNNEFSIIDNECTMFNLIVSHRLTMWYIPLAFRLSDQVQGIQDWQKQFDIGLVNSFLVH